MFVSKVNISKLNFKGISHAKNSVGQNFLHFYYAYDHENETCEIQLYKAQPNYKYNYIINESPLKTYQLTPEGIYINPQDIGIGKNEPFAYEIIRKDKLTGEIIYKGPDTGVNMRPHTGNIYGFRIGQNKQWTDKEIDGIKFSYETNDFQDATSNYKYTLVSQYGTTPKASGAAYLASPDSFKPGVKYDAKTGKLIYDKEYQKKLEGQVKNFSNVSGGSLAGLQEGIKYLKGNGYKTLITTPYANGAKPWSLGYWNINNNQMSEGMGNTENFASFFIDLYKNDIKNVNDGTFTSEGWEGIHLQYALRHGDNAQTKYWFKFVNKDAPISIGAIPENAQNLRFRIINAKYNSIMQSDGTYKNIPNPNYNPNKKTLGQIYDLEQASERQIKDYDKAIENYENIINGKLLDYNSHDDTLVNLVFDVDNKIYDKNIKKINELIKSGRKDITLDSLEGTIIATEMPEYKLSRKTDSGIVTWDANTDMFKMNYQSSGYDQKQNRAITNLSLRNNEQLHQQIGAYEVQDLTIQSGIYWTGKVKDIQTLYTAQTLKGANTFDAINKLIEENKLPISAKIDEQAISNIINGQYLLQPKGVMNKDDITVKSLMKLPLDSLELSNDTVGVLSTSYFSNRATTADTVGKTRFELMKDENPHLIEPYRKNYEKINSLYKNELKNFTDEIIKAIDTKSNEKLINSDGSYTEYGEYVIELVGQDITKYAYLKALGGDNFETNILPNGDITYNYKNLKENTSLKELGIKSYNPTQEAELLADKIEKGLKKLNSDDVEYIANSINQRLSGTNVNSFRLAEAIVDKAALGLDWRIDAAKDIMDMDAIKNEDNSFDDNFEEVIKFWKKFVDGIKTQNPNSYIVAEMTDIPDLHRFTYGEFSNPYDGETNVNNAKFNGALDSMTKFFNETGVTSEAAYDYFFTDLLTSFAPAFDTGDGESYTHDGYKNKIDYLLQTRNPDYLRNMYNFAGNQDKPRILDFALDMKLFHNKGDKTQNALDAMMVLSGSKDYESIPIELRLNANNADYLNTVSMRAVAMSKLLMSILNEEAKDTLSQEDRELVNDALVDLTNGNYMGVGETINYQRMQIKELSSLDAALDEILTTAKSTYGLSISEAELSKLKSDIISNANKDFKKYVIKGGFDWINENDALGKHNRKLAYAILNKKDSINDVTDENISDPKMYNGKYSLYTISLASLLRDSFIKTNSKSLSKDAIFSAFKDFVEKYDENTVNSQMKDLPKYDTPNMAMRKNGYAARDIKTAITMAVNQAEFKSGKKIENRDKFIDTMYKYATEPAVGKGTLMLKFLSNLFGMPTMYAGDEMGMTGYEEKTKNIYLQNRNVLPWSEIESDSQAGEYRRKIMQSMNGAMSIRSSEDAEALNNGTPYSTDVEIMAKNREQTQQKLAYIKELLKTNPVNKEDLLKEKAQLEKNLSIISFMMYNANGEATITLFDASGIRHGNRVNYFELNNIHNEAERQKFFKDNEIESIDEKNPYVPILPKSEVDSVVLASSIALPVGTIFMNIDKRDSAKYVVKDIDGKRAIVREGGGKITIKNGVTVLKRIVKGIHFKGRNATFYNKQFNIAPYTYQQKQKSVDGKKLSIIAG